MTDQPSGAPRTASPSPLPGGLRERYADRTWRRVTDGHSGADVVLLEGTDGRTADLYLKTAPLSAHPDPGVRPDAEGPRIDWLRGQGIPTAEVVEHGHRDGTSWLVTTAVPGRSAAAPWPRHRRAAVLDALADFALTLHALPVADCPFRRDPAAAVPAARRATALGLVDTKNLDDERLGAAPEDLLAELERTRPAEDALDPAVCHGDYCLPNVLLDPETLAVTGVIDLGRLGIADRHQDLALGHRSIADAGLNPQFGGEPAAGRFLARYASGTGGRPVRPALLAWHRLLDEFF